MHRVRAGANRFCPFFGVGKENMQSKTNQVRRNQMKFNQWTLGLAAVGVISLASAARAEEGAVPLLTALSATTISGYVDTSAQWNLGTGNANNPPYKFGGADKADGFNLDVIQLR